MRRHADKAAEFIADLFLDGYLAVDPYTRVACEVLCNGDEVVVAGRNTSGVSSAIEGIVRGRSERVATTSIGLVQRRQGQSSGIDHASILRGGKKRP